MSTLKEAVKNLIEYIEQKPVYDEWCPVEFNKVIDDVKEALKKDETIGVPLSEISEKLAWPKEEQGKGEDDDQKTH